MLYPVSHTLSENERESTHLNFHPPLQALREADELAAWIFFVFSVVVNMILINMMIAIINIAFEEIKGNRAKFESKFHLKDYVKRRVREVVGVTLAR